MLALLWRQDNKNFHEPFASISSGLVGKQRWMEGVGLEKWMIPRCVGDLMEGRAETRVEHQQAVSKCNAVQEHHIHDSDIKYR